MKPTILTNSNLGTVIEGDNINTIINIDSTLPVNYTILSSNLPDTINIITLNNTTYQVLGNVGLYSNSNKLELVIRFYNDDGFSDKYFYINVTNIIPQWNQDVLPDGSSYEYYEFLFTVFNQGGNTTFSLIEGELPNNLTLREDGLLYGICELVTNVEIKTFKIRATTETLVIDKEFTITVNPIAQPKAPVWLTPEGLIGTIVNNQNVNIKLLAYDVNGNPLSFSLISGALPAGLVLNIDGTITGILNTDIQATYPLIVRVSDGIYNVDRSFTIQTNTEQDYSIEWITSAGNIDTLKTGQYSSLNIVATSKLPLNYKIIFGALPEGLYLHNTDIVGHVNNQVSGTYTFTIRASNTYVSLDRSFNIIIEQGTISNSHNYYLYYNDAQYKQWWKSLWKDIDVTMLYRSSDMNYNFNTFPKTYVSFNVLDETISNIETLIACDVPFDLKLSTLQKIEYDDYDVIIKNVEPIVDKNISTLNGKKRFTFKAIRNILTNSVGIDGNIENLPQWMKNTYIPCVEICRVSKQYSAIVFDQLKAIDDTYTLPVLSHSTIIQQDRANQIINNNCIFYKQYDDMYNI